MANGDEGTGLPIGDVLKRTRTRQKVDIRTVEERTKIRIKYLRALENEEWDTLPGPPYAKGFLRTYADFLGLDGDALVDEYRRTVESRLGAEQAFPLEPVLERHTRLGEEPGRRRPVVPALVALGAAGVIVLLVLGLTGGSDNEGRHAHRGKAGQDAQRRAGEGGPGAGQVGQATGPSQPVTLLLTARDDVEACLVPGEGRPLIDSQTLIAGSRSGPYRGTSFRLDLDSGGIVDLTVNGKLHTVRSGGPVTYEIASGGILRTGFRGFDCP